MITRRFACLRIVGGSYAVTDNERDSTGPCGRIVHIRGRSVLLAIVMPDAPSSGFSLLVEERPFGALYA